RRVDRGHLVISAPVRLRGRPDCRPHRRPVDAPSWSSMTGRCRGWAAIGAARSFSSCLGGSKGMKGRAMTDKSPVTARQSWKALQAHQGRISDRHLRTLFAGDPTRGERLTAEAVGIYLDYSKNCVTDETITLLCRLAEESGLRERIDAMFRGDKIN